MQKLIEKIKSVYTGKDVLVAFQHTLTMLGGTIIVPLACGMNISMAIICAGIGTVLFFFISKKQVPVFLGSSFSFLVAYIAIMGNGIDASKGETIVNLFTTNYDLWCVNMGKIVVALFIASLCYVAFSLFVKFVGVDKVKKIFSPVVIGPVVIIIGLILCQSVIQSGIWAQIAGNEYGGSVGTVAGWKVWTTVLVTIATIVCINVFCKQKNVLKIMPIICGFVVGTIYALAIGYPMAEVKVDSIVIFQDIFSENSILGFWKCLSFDLNAVLFIVPIAFVSMIEHIGDISANSIVCGKDFLVEPGLHRTLLGDGVSTAVACMFGSPSNTTYSQNTAVLALTKNYKPTTILLAGIFAILLGLFTPFASLIYEIPKPVIGGASIILFGMISASGMRNLIDNRVDLSNAKNLICVSITLATGIGFSIIGGIQIGSVVISALCLAMIVAVVANIVLPDGNKRGNAKKEDVVGVKNGQDFALSIIEDNTKIMSSENKNSESIDNENVNNEKMNNGNVSTTNSANGDTNNKNSTTENTNNENGTSESIVSNDKNI